MAESREIPYDEYRFDPVFLEISTRFRIRHAIELKNHIASMTKLTGRLEEGFDFVAVDHRQYENALRMAGFQHDLQEKHLGFIPSVGWLAAAATHGEGYREVGSPSLHCAVARDVCNVHLDNIGFRLHGYGPDAGQHIVDELAWQAILVPALGKLLPKPVTDVLHRFHPVVPNSRQMKPFSEVGVEFDLFSHRSRDLQQHLRVTIDVTHACSDVSCGAWREIDGKSAEGENKVMLKFQVVGW